MSFAMVDNERFFIQESSTQLPINITRTKSVHKNLLLASNNDSQFCFLKNCCIAKTKVRPGFYVPQYFKYYIISMGCKDKHSIFIAGESELLKGKAETNYMIPSIFIHSLKNRYKPYKE